MDDNILDLSGADNASLGVLDPLCSPEVNISQKTQKDSDLFKTKTSDILVHTEGGPALLSATLWPCLKTPMKGRNSYGQMSTKEIMPPSDIIKTLSY